VRSFSRGIGYFQPVPPAPTAPSTGRPPERSLAARLLASRARASIALGASATVIGIFVAGAAPIARTAGADGAMAQQGAGGIVVLLGWALLAWGIHRFGRDGSGGR
jgi:hypothetical protein